MYSLEEKTEEHSSHTVIILLLTQQVFLRWFNEVL